MRRTRRLSLVMLVAVALVSMSCGGGDDSESSAPETTATTDTPASSGSTAALPTTTTAKVDPKLCPVKALDTAKGVEVTFWHSMTAANEDALKKLTDKYNASQTKVKVTLKYQGTYDESLQKYIAGVRGGELPSR